MRAAVFAGPQQIRISPAAVPEPGDGEVLVRLQGCGICHSNLPVWEGRPWFNYPMEAGSPGHEGWGVIEAMGDNVNGLQTGQRVAMLSYHAYAQFDTAPAAQVVPIPACLDGEPLPGEPLGCAMNILRRSAVQPGETLAIVGIGFLGALLTSLASHLGAHVIAISRRQCALEMARRMGAEETIPMEDHWKIIEQVKDLTNQAGCDCVVEAVGEQWPLDLASDLTRERGRLIIAGYHQDGLRQVNMQSWNWKGLDVINAHERDPQVYIQGIRDAIDALSGRLLEPAPLYSHVFTLNEMPQAFQMLKDRPDGFFKGLVLYE